MAPQVATRNSAPEEIPTRGEGGTEWPDWVPWALGTVEKLY